MFGQSCTPKFKQVENITVVVHLIGLAPLLIIEAIHAGGGFALCG